MEGEGAEGVGAVVIDSPFYVFATSGCPGEGKGCEHLHNRRPTWKGPQGKPINTLCVGPCSRHARDLCVISCIVWLTVAQSCPGPVGHKAHRELPGQSMSVKAYKDSCSTPGSRLAA